MALLQKVYRHLGEDLEFFSCLARLKGFMDNATLECWQLGYTGPRLPTLIARHYNPHYARLRQRDFCTSKAPDMITDEPLSRPAGNGVAWALAALLGAVGAAPFDRSATTTPYDRRRQ
jgi:hypothetical protein